MLKTILAAGIAIILAVTSAFAASYKVIIENRTGEILPYLTTPKSTNFPPWGITSTKDTPPLIASITTKDGTDFMKVKNSTNGTCTVIFDMKNTGSPIIVTRTGNLKCASDGNLLVFSPY